MTQNSEVLVSIIISVRDDERICSCLDSIYRRGRAKFTEAFEVIVIENSDEPWLENVVRQFPVRYLVEPRLGMGYARQLGICHAQGSYLVFTDADCVVSEGWLRNLLSPFSEPDVGVVGGPICKSRAVTFTEKHQRDLVIGGQHALQYLPPIYSRPYVVTANAAYKAAAVEAAGGIDPIFFSGGDVDLAWRIGDLGYDLVIAQEALVYHACRDTARAIFRQFHRYSMGHALLFRKFKKRTGKRICINTYPFFGIIKALIRVIAAFFRQMPKEDKRTIYAETAFQLVEYVALISGAITGSIRYRVLYI